MGISQLSLLLLPSLLFPSHIVSSSLKMSAPIEYRNSVTPKPYELAPMPPALSFEDYKALTEEWTAAEECYEEAVGRHNDWKTVHAKEARAGKLRQDKLARLLKVEALKKEKEEAERRAEEERKAEAKRKEDERVAKKLKEKEEAAEHKRLADLKEKEDREKEQEKEDEANELALQAAGVPSASDGDTKADPADPKTAAMTELRRRRSIAKGKKRVEIMEPRKRKFRSDSMVDDSGEEGGCALGGAVEP